MCSPGLLWLAIMFAKPHKVLFYAPDHVQLCMKQVLTYVKRLLTYTAEFGRSMYFRLALSSGWCRDHNAFVRILSTTMNL